MAEEKRKDLLIWIDLETTGFDNDYNMLGVQKHKLLEVGMHITDSNFNIVDKGFEVVIHYNDKDLFEYMDEYAKDFHQKSGLIDKVRESPFSLQMAEKMMLSYVEDFNIAPKSSPICGNNVGFDKNFIDAKMPEFSKFLHYRKIDVSSFKEFALRQYPEVADLVKKQMKHRGLDDIKESIAELKLYQKHLFVPTNEVPQDLISNKKIKPSI